MGFELTELQPPEVFARLRSGELDVGVVVIAHDRALPDTGVFQSRLLAEQPLMVAIPSRHRLAGRRHLSLASLAGEAWLLPARERFPEFRAEVDRLLAGCGVVPRRALDSSDDLAGARLVAAGVGVALVPAIAVPIMAAAVAAATVWRMRSGERQDLSIDLRQAIHGITPHYAWHPRINGLPHGHPLVFDNFFLLAPYKTRDSRTVMACGVYPHLAASWLRFLDCPPEWEKVLARFAQWDAFELEQAANAAGLPLTIARTVTEWAEHPQGAQLARTPVITLEKIADSPPQPFAAEKRPLSGVRVLSFTHAIAGPTVGRTLAEHGADVLNGTFPNHFEHDFVYNEANVGSRSANLDLRIAEHAARVQRLLADADVVVENHRPGTLARFGLSPEQLTARHPGIVCVSVSAYGPDGPWADRAGSRPPTGGSSKTKSGERDSNSRHPPWEGGALPTELPPPDGLRRARRGPSP